MVLGGNRQIGERQLGDDGEGWASVQHPQGKLELKAMLKGPITLLHTGFKPQPLITSISAMI